MKNLGKVITYSPKLQITLLIAKKAVGVSAKFGMIEPSSQLQQLILRLRSQHIYRDDTAQI
jgi:hypothetical protein